MSTTVPDRHGEMHAGAIIAARFQWTSAHHGPVDLTRRAHSGHAFHVTAERVLAAQRAAFAREPFPSAHVRRDRLRRLRDIVTTHERRLVEAVSADFGGRSPHETRLAELFIVASECTHAQRLLRRWMRTERVATPMHLLPGRARIERRPVGVVGVVSPWNYPVQLALAPLIGALAAGNRVMLKPSELTQATSALLAELVAAAFAEDEVAVVLGGADVGRAFVALPFDHLFFTGSTAVGRAVARAAADNLTPVTLELGGKSPALLAPDADFALAAPRIMSGKLLNAGQTCIAPDYALVPQGREDDFVAAVTAAASALYPAFAGNADYTSIVNARHAARLAALVEDARAHGARIVTVDPAQEAGAASPGGSHRMLPVLIVGATDAMQVMREEIFGPLLPVETYRSLDDAIARVAGRPHPLAFYYFGSTGAQMEQVLARTRAGGVTVNDTLWHFAHPGLPFGGVGASGIGAYHGEASFLAFTHRTPVFVQPRLSAGKLLYPPYGKTFEKVLALLRKLAG